MGRFRNTLVAAAIGAALTASSASASEAVPPQPQPTEAPQEPASGSQLPAAVPPASTTEEPASPTPAPALQQGTTLAAPPAQAPQKQDPSSTAKPTGGTTAGKPGKLEAAPTPSQPAPSEETLPVPGPSSVLSIPSIPTSTCAPTGVPPVLIPMYHRAAAAYDLGPQGPAVLAGINEVETAFGTNLNVSSAGAVGWMQFMPSTWETYGVDANGDGVRDPYDPEDAIFAAARYLSAAGMPADTYGAIYAYNHAGWYVAEVLANAGCYAGEVGDNSFSAAALGPQIPVMACQPAAKWKKQIPHEYLSAFEDAAGRYELGKRGVWTLAAIAHLESNFGRGMTKRQLRTESALGLDPMEWKHFAVDGDNDGKVRHGDIADAAATLARLIWSKGSINAGVFTHNQAQWYVEQVDREAGEIEGGCKVHYIDWRIAPLSTGFETPGSKAALGRNGLASAPRSAPPAVKAVIAAANSISRTPYVWGGGHGSWYSYGYDCSGAVSFALYGGGLLDAPLTSGDLESYGEPGPGKWITIYANATHAYAVIAGLRWDTVGDASGTGPRWHPEPPYPAGFVVRHPAGY